MTEVSDNLNQSISRHPREKAIKEIATRGIVEAALAEKFDVFTGGARRILAQKEWSANLGLRVLEALDVSVDVKFPGISET